MAYDFLQTLLFFMHRAHSNASSATASRMVDLAIRIFGPQSQSRCVKIKFKVTTVFLQLVPLSLFALAEK
jgi:hypothetical protein